MARNKLLLVIAFLFLLNLAKSQSIAAFADSIRKKYNIPELAFAVVSQHKVLEMQALGYKKINSSLIADINDRFRLGSNTKTITAFLAAQLVKQGKISWSTKFFDLFPGLKQKSNPAHHHLTLLNLLSFRTKLIPWTYTYPEPTQEQITGNEEEQRYQFVAWIMAQPPANRDSVNFCNPGYVAAGLMLEKASGQSYKQMVAALGKELKIDFSFGQPNYTDSLQPWGHNENLNPEPPADSYKLGWLLPAGNISVSLPDYVKFIQLQLLGLAGKSELLPEKEFIFLHCGLPRFAVGWFWNTDESGQLYSHHTGNPGSFLSKVYVFKNTNRAYILFANAQTDAANQGMNVLYEELLKRYNK